MSHLLETRIDVADFDLDPRDITPALARALQHARSVPGPKRVVVPPGVYHVQPEHAAVRELYVSNTVGSRPEHRDKRIAILLEDDSDITVDGQGATLVLHGQQTIFAMIRTRRACIRGFSVDWVTPRAIDLTVLHKGADHHDVLVADGYRYRISGTEVTWYAEDDASGDPHWVYHRPRPTGAQLPDLGYDFMQFTDLRTGRAHGGGMLDQPNPLRDGLVAVREVSPGVLRHTYGDGGAPSELGTVFQLRSTMRDTPGAFLWEATDSVIADMEIGYLHGFGMIAQMTDSVTVRGVRFRTPAGSGRTTVGFADLVQISGDKGTVVIEDNDFGFSHDDAINIHGTYVQLTATSGATGRFRFMHHETSGFPLFHPGDEVALVDRSTMLDLPDWTGTVLSVDGPSGVDHSRDLETMSITFDKPLPEAAVAGHVVAENLTYNPSVVVRRNRFKTIATRGILVTTRGPVLIEDNTFDSVEMASIFVSADSSQWYESSVVRDVVIRDNVFLRPMPSSKGRAEILIEPTAGAVPSQAAHSGIVIEGNTFLIEDTVVLDAKSVSGFRFSGNTVVRHGREPSSGLEHLDRRPLAILRGCTAAEFADNTLGEGISGDVVTHGMDGDDLVVGEFARLEPTQSPVAMLLSVESEGLDVPPLPWFHDGVVVRAPDELASLRIRFRAQTGHAMSMTVNGRPADPDSEGWLSVELDAGATVVECVVGAPEGVSTRVHRCVLLRAA